MGALSGGGGALSQIRVDRGQRRLPVDPGFARAEQIQIGAVQNEKSRHEAWPSFGRPVCAKAGVVSRSATFGPFQLNV